MFSKLVYGKEVQGSTNVKRVVTIEAVITTLGRLLEEERIFLW